MMAECAGESPVLVISGMHRSGTSLTASLCQASGLFIGPRLMGSSESNIPGHFEDLEFFDLHQRMLAANSLCPTGLVAPTGPLEVPEPLQAAARGLVAARQAVGQPWGWKDPRTVLFLDFWKTLLPRAKWLFVVRSPWAVVDSLFRRGDAVFLDNPPLTVRVWHHYNHLIREFAVRHPDDVVVVDVAQVASEPGTVVATLRSRFGLALSDPPRLYREGLLAATHEWQREALLREAAPESCGLYEELRRIAGLEAVSRPAGWGREPLGAAGIALIDWARSVRAADGLRTLGRDLAEARDRAEGLARVVAEHEATLSAIDVADLESQVTRLDQALGERERQLVAVRQTAQEQASRIEGLTAELAAVRAERAETIAEMERQLADRVARQTAQEQAFRIEGLTAELAAARAERAETVADMERQLADSEERLRYLEAGLADAQVTLASRDDEIAHRARNLMRVEEELREHVRRADEIIASNSWRLTAPLRDLRRGLGRLRREPQRGPEWVARRLRRLYDRLPIGRRTRLAHRRLLAARWPQLLVASGSPPSSVPGCVTPAAAPTLRAAAPSPAEKRVGGEWPPLRLPSGPAPLVSIVIPVHDKWHYTHACLRSIVEAEPGLDFQVILADDASTDDTRNAARWVDGLTIVRHETKLGFIGNCNAAVREARGRYVLFLNNDTSLQPGAISSLVDVFRTRPDAGLVGSKLVYPDGRLQEAGGIIWADGSGWNYGRGQDATLPEFNYLRETDYCSGASLMVPKPLLDRLGGFDERYAPAYYEDTDLAFAVRAAGLRVYYQPASVVVHYEGASHGTDISQGVKACQVENQARFVAKWRETLTRDHLPNGTDVFHARDRSIGRRCMLVVDHYVPQPDRDAGSRVMWAFLRLFVGMGMNVKFWPQNLHYDPDYAPALEQLGVEVFHGPRFAGRFAAWAREHGPQLDVAFLSRPHVAEECIAPLRRHSAATLLFYGHDLHHARLRREFELTGDQRLLEESRRIRELEESIWRQVDRVYYPSAEETAVVRETCPRVPARTVPLYFFDRRTAPNPGPEGRTGILFVAGFAHPPNVDAATWLVREILPLVRREVGGVHLSLVGSNPTPAVRDLAGEGVTVTGYVPDEQLERIYRTSRVAIVPLRFGAGVKSKVIEAMHHGVPLVTTPVGAQGLEDLGSVLPVAADPVRLAGEVVALLRDDARWRAVAAAGERYVDERFSADAMRRAFEMDVLAGVEAPGRDGIADSSRVSPR